MDTSFVEVEVLPVILGRCFTDGTSTLLVQMLIVETTVGSAASAPHEFSLVIP
jgi:hypothetical protein